MKTAFVRDNVRYTFCIPDTGKFNHVYLAISAVNLAWENIYKIPIRKKSGVAFQINKRSISADDGAHGFFLFVKRCIDNDLGMVYIDKIIQAVITDLCYTEVYTG